MPTLKRTDRQKRIASVEGVIHEYRMLYGYKTHNSVMAFLGLKRTAYYKRRKNPESWRVGEIDTLIRVLHIPVSEMLNALYGNNSGTILK